MAVALVTVTLSPIVRAAGGLPPHNLTPPIVTGTPVVGQTLSTTSGTWSGTSPMTFTYRWLRCPPGGTCAAITGATSTTYKLSTADLGDTIKSAVTARNLADAEP